MRLLRRQRPGFLTRLGNIIVIQVIFVFAALAIIIFYPEKDNSVDSEYIFLREKLQQSTKQIRTLMENRPDGEASILQDQALQKHLAQLLDIDNLAQGYLFIRGKDDRPRKLFTLRAGDRFDHETRSDVDFDQLVDRSMIAYQIGMSDEVLVPVIHNNRYFVYYYRFQPENWPPLIAVAISDHQELTSRSGQIRYTFLILFLVSALVSLLTVYLINKRFQEPLERLTTGFERTVKGELYSLVETDMDSELSKLAAAYNDMSLTLWENHRKLSEYNARLEEANQMLAESQEFLGTLIDSSPTCIIAAFPDGEIMLFNRKASEVFGRKRQDIIGRKIDDLFTHKLSEIKTSKAIIGDNHSLEVLCRRGDGSLFPAYLISAPVNTGGGEIWAYLYLVKDITESKNFQDMMIRLDRYYTRGEMAGDIAHEINNFLAILSGNIELMPLLMKNDNQGKIAQKLEVMKATVDRIARFTDGLMDSNEDEVRFEMADINQLIQTVIAFLKPQNRFDRIEVRTCLSTEIPIVRLDSSQMQQLLVNLLYNASEALADKEGERLITIRTKLDTENASRRIILEVTDNGPGVPSDKEDLLFHKRFTTKPRGHGIGLITCKRIADTHEGTIGYEHREGAVFSVELPLVEKADWLKESVVPACESTGPPA
jgi:PAS domain S-box-containing protein